LRAAIKNSEKFEDDGVVAAYEERSRSADQFEADLGNYSLGFIASLQDREEQALEFYARVTDQRFPYLQNSVGFVYMKKDNFARAERHFKKAIEIEDNIGSAYSNLSGVYVKTKNTESLRELIDDESAAMFIGHHIKRKFFFQTKQLVPYSRMLIKKSSFTTLSLIGGVLTLLVWLIYLIRVDVFEREQPIHIVFALMLGGVFTMLATPLYDVYSEVFGFDLSGGALHELLYCIFAIGFIEETVKIIPFLILLRFRTIVNESTDYIVYASLVALSFAFLENLLYFYPDNFEAITPRLLTANILHMAFTSFIAFAVLYAEQKKRSVVLYFAMGFIVAAVAHGLYDFFLLTESAWSEFKILSIAIAVWCIAFYARALYEALSWSEFKHSSDTEIRSVEYLLVAIMLVVAYQFVATAITFGAKNANLSLLVVLLVLLWAGFYILSTLGNFRILKDKSQ